MKFFIFPKHSFGEFPPAVFYLIPPTIRLNRVYSSTGKIIEGSGRLHALMEAKMKALDSINPFFFLNKI